MRLLKDMLLGTAMVMAASTEGNGGSIAVADSVIDLAELANANPDFSDEVNKFTDAEEEVKYAPVPFGMLLQEIHGDTLQGFAKPGSEVSTNEYHAEKYKIRVTKNGETKDEARNFFTVYYNATTVGQALLARKAELTEARKTGADMSLVKSTDIRENINDKRWLEAEIKLVENRMTAGRKLIRTAAEIIFAMMAVNEIEGVGARFDMYKVEGKDMLRRTKNPIVVYSTVEGEGHKFALLSVSQLVTLAKPENIGAVKEDISKGSAAFDAIADSMRREGGSGQGGIKTIQKIETVDTLQTFLNLIGTYLDFDANDGKAHLAAVLKKLKAKGDDHDELVQSIGSAFIGIQTLYAHVEDEFVASLSGATTAKDKAA